MSWISLFGGHLGFLASGLAITLLVSVLSCVLSLAVGTLLGAVRAYGGYVARLIIGVYSDAMRALPLLVVLLYAYFAVPIMLGRSIGSITAAVTGLTLWWAAAVSEAVRAGLLSVSRGQRMAALALGMTRVQAEFRVVLPQALVRILPIVGSTFVMIIKDSALASVIAVPELLRQSEIVATQTFRPFPILTLILIVYFVIVFPVARWSDRLYARLQARGVGR